LPPESENSAKWDFMRPLLANPALDPQPQHIQATLAGFEELLQIRESSPLFRLGDADLVQERLDFYNTGPTQREGLIVMGLDDTTGVDLDSEHEGVVVLFNSNDEPMTFQISALARALFRLHPIQAASADSVVRGATFDPRTGTFTVPARTTAVFVRSQATPTCTVMGTNGNDVLLGTSRSAVVCAVGGSDVIITHAGDDIVFAGGGNDVVIVDGGDDVVYGEAGNDVIVAGAGDDTVDGGPGLDVCTGGPGADAITNCEIKTS
jgi:Ca2+-binding RTX toxin-like protein